MSPQFAMSAMSLAEFALWAVIAFLFWKKRLYRRFPAMGSYLGLRLGSMPFLLAALYIQAQPWGRNYFPVYFFSYWTVYLASAVLLFFVSMEIFKSALIGFPGLMKIGVVIFRWAVLVSVIVTFSTVSIAHRGLLAIPELVAGLMRSVSLLELCLLGFLCLSMNALRLSVRDIAFGIALGFGLMSCNDFVVNAVISHSAPLTAPMQFVYEGVLLATLAIWAVYCWLPEPARKPVVMPASSAIYRWNEIASALGHTGTQVAVPQTANSFFLTDVEKVVEKVLTKNLKRRESEL
jgi:hypothetical protein